MPGLLAKLSAETSAIKQSDLYQPIICYASAGDCLWPAAAMV
jgi:hypothetical protein